MCSELRTLSSEPGAGPLPQAGVVLSTPLTALGRAALKVGGRKGRGKERPHAGGPVVPGGPFNSHPGEVPVPLVTS